MKKKIWGFALISILAIVGVVCGAVLSVPSKTPMRVKAAEYLPGFEYAGPGGDGTHPLTPGYSGVSTSYFKLNVRNESNGVTEVQRSLVRQSGVHTIALPVYSPGEMDTIIRGNAIERKLPAGVPVDYGFVMLRPGENVVLELTNLMSAGVGAGTRWRRNNAVNASGQPVWNGDQSNTASGIWNMESISDEALLTHARGNPNRLFRNSGVGTTVTLTGVFDLEGYYEFQLRPVVNGPVGTVITSEMNFGFYIVHEEEYAKTPFLVHDKDADGSENPYQWGKNGQYYYNFEDEAPYLRYKSNRFEVEVEGSDVLGLKADNTAYEKEGLKYRDFDKLGDYEITARAGYYDATYRGAAGPAPRFAYAPYSNSEYSLNIFGAQAYYENYDVSRPGKSAKQLPFDESGKIGANRSGEGAFAAAMNFTVDTVSTLYVTTQTASVTPAVTNSPPVSLRSNVLSTGQVFYNDGSGWKESTSISSNWKFDKDGFFERAGEYFIVVNYKYSVADVDGNPKYHPITNPEVRYRQILYFKIVNYVEPWVEATIKGTTTKEKMYFNELVQRRANLNDPGFIVYLHNNQLPSGELGADGLGPYELAPKVALSHRTWNDQPCTCDPACPLKQETFLNVTNGRIEIPTLAHPTSPTQSRPDGLYVFRVYFGNTWASWMNFTVAVDTEPLRGEGVIKSTGKSFDLGDTGINPNTFGLFGPGQVSIQWDNKTSLFGYSTVGATVKFYGFEHTPGYTYQGGGNVYTSRQLIDSPSRMSVNMQETDHRIEKVFANGQNQPSTGWKIVDTFSRGGVYFVEIKDEVGNASNLAFIIDDTKASFEQNPRFVPTSESNRANIVNAESVDIAYGIQKRVVTPDLGGKFPASINSVYQSLLTGGILTSTAMIIPIVTHQISTDNRNWDTLVYDNTKPDNQQMYNYNRLAIRLTDEKFYYLRSFDSLGNDTNYYVWLNQDVCRGMVLEDSKPGLEQPSSTGSQTASVVRPDGVGKLEYLYFSFQTKQPDNKYIVDMIQLQFLPFDFTSTPETNPNYPFVKGNFEGGVEPVTIWDNTDAYTKSGGFPTGILQNPNEQPITKTIKLNQIRPGTPDGLYILTRFYNYHYHPSDDRSNNSAIGQDQVRSYFFMVDRHEVVPFSGQPFQSDFKIRFGSKDADWRTLGQQIHSNATPVQIILPVDGTKYGGSQTLANLRYFDKRYTGYPVPSVSAGSLWGLGTPQKSKTLAALELNVEVLRDGVPERTTWGPFDDGSGGKEKKISNWYNDNGRYRVTVKDGTGGINWQPFADSATDVPANTVVFNFVLDKNFSSAEWVLNGKALLAGNPDTFGWNTSIKVTPADNLDFRFANDASDFYTEIVDEATQWRIDGILLGGAQRPLEVTDPNTDRYRVHTYKLADKDDWVNHKLPKGDEIVHVSLYWPGRLPEDPPSVTYTMTVDNKPPSYNLIEKPGSIRERDKLFPGIRLYEDYVYAVGNDFAFQGKPTENPQSSRSPFDVHDTDYISYRQVDTDFTPNAGAATPFKYGNIPFAGMVGLQAKETRIYEIYERDEAWNEQTYYIQLRGDEYYNEYKVDNIVVDGKLTGGNLIDRNTPEVFGSSITIEANTTYWENNPTFEWSYSIGANTTRQFFTRLKGETNEYRKAAFDDWVQIMLDRGRDTIINLEINDGFNEPYTIHISQNPDHAFRAILEVERVGSGGGELSVKIKNLAALRQKFDNINFWLRVYTLDKDGLIPRNPDNTRKADEVVIDNIIFNGGNPIPYYLLDRPLSGYGNKDVVLILTDSFGNETVVQHHGGERQDFARVIFPSEYAGWPVREGVIGGVTYTGYEDGVRIVWNSQVYNVAVNGVQIIQKEHMINGCRLTVRPDPATGFDMIELEPPPIGIAGTADPFVWQAVFSYRASDAPPKVHEWRFYREVPPLTFRNINGNDIANEVAAGKVGGMAEVTIDRQGYLFGSVISYTRTFDGDTDPTASMRFTTRFVLDQKGEYIVTVTNDVYATRTYKFDILDVFNLSYKIRYNDPTIDNRGNMVGWRDLKESPESLSYNAVYPGIDANGDVITVPVPPPPIQAMTRNIPVFWVNKPHQTSNVDILVDPLEPDLFSESGAVQIVPSMNYKRKLVHVGGNSNENARWEFYYLYSETTGSRLYFALACTTHNNTTLTLRTQEATAPTFSTVLRNSKNQFYRSIGGGKLTVTLNEKATPAGAGATNNPTSTNVYYADYYQGHRDGGQYLGRIYGNPDKLTIEAQDYGEFKFYVYDWADNTIDFDGVDHFTIYNFTRPPLRINGDAIIDEMVYSGNFDLEVIEVSDVSSADRYMYLSYLRVERDGSVIHLPGSDQDGAQRWDTKHEQNRFPLTAYGSGRYRIIAEYNTGIQSGTTGTGPNGSIIVRSEHIVQFVSPSNILTSFYFSGASNMRVTSVFRSADGMPGSGIDVSRDFGISRGSSVDSLLIHSNPKVRGDDRGYYHITFEVDSPSVRNVLNEQKEREKVYYVTCIVRIWLIASDDDRALVRLAGKSTFGKTHTKSVTLVAVPQQIILAADNNDAFLTIYCNGKVLEPYEINTSMKIDDEPFELTDENGASKELRLTYGDAGTYQVVVTAANGHVIFADGFTVKAPMNTMVLIIVLSIAGVAVLGIFIFIKLRTRMRVK